MKYSNSKHYANVIYFYNGHLPHCGGGDANTSVEYCSITADGPARQMWVRDESGPNIVLRIYIFHGSTHFPSGGAGSFGGNGCSGCRMGSTGASPKLVQAQLCILAYIVANPCRNQGVGHQEFTQQDVQRTNL
ncbi:unnamed protein product [Macrosiphum euphorbiae]|uniref:Uncharacterized protein n=1 Tax=Macrosiphum euphorbiae TaxID=13131 RepID=A0AAV0WHU0_9HEMI|nr:unnamed protein product [Macrosiphum euphorbiae]